MNLFSLKDAGIADMRKSPDENVYEQRKVKEGYTAEESYDSMKNIPLKDSNVNYGADQVGYGVKVVSPGDGNAMNKWADILKVFANFVRPCLKSCHKFVQHWSKVLGKANK